MTAIGDNANAQLRSIVERIENLESDKADIAESIKEIYSEAKSSGYDPKVLRAVVRRRKQDKNDLAEFEAVLETYLNALGSLSDLPLGQAALKRAGLSPQT